MGRTVEARCAVPVAASGETVWQRATDWASQGEWMLGTEVFVVDGHGGLGATLAAFTGAGSVGVLDTMRIVRFEPPHRCRVEHTGNVVRGEGGFEVVREGPHSARFVWWEALRLPTALAWGWPLARPAFLWGLRRSLETFARLCREREGSAGERD
ncbi:SRPBCC family protein [Allosaccharopolyspora coralli]|uniref:SRPBCC family protein n=1 Tax=Allosaccharopolyspora coralli TaxID=2665642 RepID=A0A5Q3Q4W6_9PSEU|nr:SRPBCC family protein [Allosaccharopolyspora coralli]QGK68870.1 SRPBCC family protein [Allosaccharopolyspora coralli]